MTVFLYELSENENHKLPVIFMLTKHSSSESARKGISSADRKVFPGYFFTTVPECRNCIFALLRKLFDLLMIAFGKIQTNKNMIK
jgi:hypothetical protein